MEVVELARDKHGLLVVIDGHVLGQLGLVLRLIARLDILVKDCLTTGCLVRSPHQKVFRLHIHALVHERIPCEEGSLHHLHLAQGRHRVGVHEC